MGSGTYQSRCSSACDHAPSRLLQLANFAQLYEKQGEAGAHFTVDFNLSLILTLVVVFGTLAGIPPMSSIIDLGESITDKANLYYGEPPYGHAELSPLKVFSERVKIDLEQSLAALKAAGIVVESPDSTMTEIAEANGITPQSIFEIIKLESHPGSRVSSVTMPVDALVARETEL